MKLNQKTLEEIFAGKPIGHQLYYYQEIGSTNDEAFRLALSGAPEGTLLIAESQSAGRGRMQRTWHSPTAKNIYTSVILRPTVQPFQAPQFSILAGVAVAEALDIYCKGRIKLKWPNDVLINEKKVCGILAQAKTSASMVDFLILGIGINVNIRNEQLPKDLRNTATSLMDNAGREISRLEIIISLYENLTKWYKQFLNDGFGQIREKWLSLSSMLNQTVQVRFQEEVVSGKAIDLDEDGSLILLTENNEQIHVSAGDATVLRS